MLSLVVMRSRDMETFTFFGRILPSNVGITIPRLQRQLAVEAIGLRLSLEFDVVASDLVAVAQVEGVADLATVRNYVVEGVSDPLLSAARLLPASSEPVNPR